MENIPRQQSPQPEARYANYFSVGHADCEVVLEFGQFYEGDQQPQAHTRIIISPANTNRFLALLQDSLRQYEAHYGAIREIPSDE